MGTPNREPQEYCSNIIGIYLLIVPLHSYYVFSGSLAGVPVKVPSSFEGSGIGAWSLR